MIKHLFKLTWNRKGANALVAVEIVVSFFVVFALVLLAVQYASVYWRPLGFSYDRVLSVTIDVKQDSDDYWTPETAETARQVLLAARSFDEVEAAAGAHTMPYMLGGSTGMIDPDGKRLEFDRNEVTDEFAAVLGLELVSGRWFGAEDNGAAFDPVVVNERFARAMFGDEDPIGKPLSEVNDRYRVVGVVSEYRRQGELAAPGNTIFFRRTYDNAERPPRNLIVRVKPGTPVDFEERLAARLQSVAREWSFRVEPLASARATNLNFWLAPLVLLGLVTGFLMLMVALGLVGVLWQSVTRRRPEIGVRRAQGASARDICLQIVGEVAVVTTIAVAVGAAVVLQLPLLDLLDFVDETVFFASLAVAAALIYLLTVACALYPSWLATRVQPAEALHYE